MTEQSELPQHMQALANANTVRLKRAELKRKIYQGEVFVGTVILDPPWEAETMAVSDLLRSQWRWGNTRVRRILQTIPMSESKTVGSMTERQRKALYEELPPNAKPRPEDDN